MSDGDVSKGSAGGGWRCHVTLGDETIPTTPRPRTDTAKEKETIIQETMNETTDTGAAAILVTLTVKELLALCVTSQKGAIGPSGLHRVQAAVDLGDTHALLVDLHKRGLVRRGTNGQYELSQAMRDHMPKALTVTVPLPDRSRSRPRVTAGCHDDDREYEVKSFDCTGWFERATDDQIRDLIDTGFSGGPASGAVAEHYDGVIDAVTDLFAHKRGGFECRVDEKRAWAWIKAHRRHLYREHRKGQVAIPGTGR